MKKLILTCLFSGLLLSVGVAGASAHGVEVTPPGQDDATVDQEVSKWWAKAHCQAEAPEKATENSEAVTFSPDEKLSCPDDAGGGFAPGPPPEEPPQ